jgi:REP element-mobilizing transposase RayT
MRFLIPRTNCQLSDRPFQGQKICLDDHDREMWLATTVQAWKRTGWLIHAWALLGNHYHLLLTRAASSTAARAKSNFLSVKSRCFAVAFILSSL